MILDRYLQTGYLLKGPYIRIENDYSKFGNLLMSISFFSLLCKLDFKQNKIITFLGKRTINIYYVHMFILKVLNKQFYSYFAQYSGAKLNLVKSIVVLIISIGITELIKIIKPLKKYLNLS